MPMFMDSLHEFGMAFSENAIRPGYDNVLRQQIRDLSDGGTGELYDGVFPGAKE